MWGRAPLRLRSGQALARPAEQRSANFKLQGAPCLAAFARRGNRASTPLFLLFRKEVVARPALLIPSRLLLAFEELVLSSSKEPGRAVRCLALFARRQYARLARNLSGIRQVIIMLELSRIGKRGGEAPNRRDSGNDRALRIFAHAGPVSTIACCITSQPLSIMRSATCRLA